MGHGVDTGHIRRGFALDERIELVRTKIANVGEFLKVDIRHGLYRIAKGLGTFALGEFAAGVADGDGHMCVFRKRGIRKQGLPEGLLARRVVEMLLAADDVCDVHQTVVHDARKVVRRKAVALSDNKIAYLLGGEGNLAADHVLDDDRMILGYGETDRYGPAFGAGFLGVFGAGEILWPGVGQGAFLSLCLFAKRIQLLGRFEAVIGFSFVQQLIDVLIVDVLALGLKVRPVGPADFGAFIPLDPEPLEVLHDLPGGGRGISLLVGVFDAEYKCPDHSFCI